MSQNERAWRDIMKLADNDDNLFTTEEQFLLDFLRRKGTCPDESLIAVRALIAKYKGRDV
jgi:hypothetical protein